MMRAIKAALLLGAMLAGTTTISLAQAGQPMDGAKAAAVEQLADQFIERLHLSFDVGAQSEMFLPQFAALHREYPGEFAPFDTPRMSSSLLTATDDATMRRKLLAEWNLYYWRWLFLTTQPVKKGDPSKALPAEFLKAAKKSQYLKCLIGEGSITLASPEELTGFLSEADQLGAILKKNVRPEMLSSEPFRAAAAIARTTNGVPRSLLGTMGFDRVYTVNRDAMTLVMVEKDNQFRLLSLAPITH